MKHRFSILLMGLALSTTSFAQVKKVNAVKSQIDSLVESYYSPDKPGIAISIIQNGKTTYSNQIGLANLEYGIAISDSTAFHIASVSKQFTSFLALLLEKEGKLSMSDDIRNHLPELKNLPYKITLNQLANHSHGLPNLFELAQLKGFGLEDRMSHRQIVDMLLSIKSVNFVPGEKFEYNNTGYVLLAEIIERASEKPFQEVLQERIFKPLTMNHSKAVNHPSLLVKNRASSYRSTSDGYKNFPFNIMANGSSGISTSISDLSKWVAIFQNPNEEQKEIFAAMQIKSKLNSGKITDYGLGLQMGSYRGLDLVFHGGGDAAYRSYILHVPKHKFSIAILGNARDFAPLYLAYSLADLFLADYLEPISKPKKLIYTTQELEKFTGTYEFCPGAYYIIVAENNQLYLKGLGSDEKSILPIIGDGEFTYPAIPTAKFSFYEEGFTYHLADFKYDCKRIELNTISADKVNLKDYTGLYKNEEFNTFYELVLRDNALVAVHSINYDIDLNPLTEDSFYSIEAFFSHLKFRRDSKGKITGFDASGQNMRDVQFLKIEP